MDRPWDVPLLEERLVEAMRSMQGAAFYTPRRNAFEILFAVRRLSHLELIAVSSEVLGRDSFERKALLTWARSRAGMGGSVSQACRDLGCSRSALDDARKRGAARVVSWINAGAALKVA